MQLPSTLGLRRYPFRISAPGQIIGRDVGTNYALATETRQPPIKLTAKHIEMDLNGFG